MSCVSLYRYSRCHVCHCTGVLGVMCVTVQVFYRCHGVVNVQVF